MRAAIYVAAGLAAAACDPEMGRSLLAGTAATLLEATPYLLTASLLGPILGSRFPAWLPFVGCGCGRGPAARSLPAAIAAAFLFGPWIAAVRVGAATAVGSIARREPGASHEESFLDALLRLAPTALIASAASAALPALHFTNQSLATQIVFGIGLGFVGAPCALGAVAMAGTLRAHSPAAALAFLCVSGIVDLRVWWQPHFKHCGDDAIAFVVVAVAAAAVAFQHGASLVHPRLATTLAVAAVGTLTSAYLKRRDRNPNARWVPAIMLVASVAGAPPPTYSATETTMADVFPGEHLDFTGRLVTNATSASIVRFAITCCRADAQPIGVVLAKRPNFRDGEWVRANGTLRETAEGLRLVPLSVSAVAPPLDPFVYR